METLTVSLTDEQYDRIEDLGGDNGAYSSKSEAVRSLLERSSTVPNLKQELEAKEDRIADLQQRNEELNKRLSDMNDLETENQRLRNEKRQLIRDKKDHREIAEFAEGHKSLVVDEYERRQAPIWQRLKWLVFGKDD